jgi:hypothetical protein
LGDKIEACTHGPRARLQCVFDAMGNVTFPKVLWYERLNGGGDEVFRLRAEQSTSLTIGILYDAPPIYREDRIW